MSVAYHRIISKKYSFLYTVLSLNLPLNWKLVREMAACVREGIIGFRHLCLNRCKGKSSESKGNKRLQKSRVYMSDFYRVITFHRLLWISAIIFFFCSSSEPSSVPHMHLMCLILRLIHMLISRCFLLSRYLSSYFLFKICL